MMALLSLHAVGYLSAWLSESLEKLVEAPVRREGTAAAQSRRRSHPML